ncbi:gephyrin-like molybdotransferase Glp [Yoonia sp. BS5-3]|uniref:Molybdopterin molybdenumtransferase n=1 Tax=Yoonia phaeophyticola TaxID=3137369 RepID=A0ABZ2V5N0_9RHOB
MVDWSGGNDRGPKPKADAIWVCAARDGVADAPVYLRNRALAEAWITDFINAERAAGRRVLAGFDFAFGYPAGFGKVLTGSDDPFAIWDWFAAHVQDAPDGNNRFDLAGQINGLFPGIGPFWGNGLKRDIANLPRKGSARAGHGMAERRQAELQAKGAFPVWQLSGAGAVGSQVIMGLPSLARLRKRFGKDLCVWPFEAQNAPIAIVEIWPSLIAKVIAATQPADLPKDAHQVFVLAQTLSRLTPDQLTAMLDVPINPEGSILGLDHVSLLTETVLGPPPLRNDCFAMPQGTHWTPVDQALTHLKSRLSVVVNDETIPLDQAAGRYLAAPVTAARAHPPAANAAVDGYGFAGPAPDGVQVLPLVQGRSAAGAPYAGDVPAGHALRILTGANLPKGVDTVVLQEDVTATQNEVRFHGPLKKGANARKAGEDMTQGQVILETGRKLTPADLGMMAAVGVGQLRVRRRLRVGILSTGDELRTPGSAIDDGQIYDANRPMLHALACDWGYEAVDLGQAPDDRERLGQILTEGAARCDVILTSGGASAGDEDHMSALLKDSGSLALWRIAMKPGRPLALGFWGQKPVFGLPGNPVAAMVCAMIFAAPALRVLAGGTWQEPQSFQVPAGFTKSKKAGRREYLRARINNGVAERFASEGSGRVSGLSWATGLIALNDGAQTIAPGDLVTFIPFSSFAA